MTGKQQTVTLSRYLKAHFPGVTLSDLEAVTGRSRNTLHHWWKGNRRELLKVIILGLAVRQHVDSSRGGDQ